MTWPAIDQAPIELPSLPGLNMRLWDALIELTDIRRGEWTLIGGQMVLLHALEHGTTPYRLSTDLDIVVNARIVSRAVAKFVAELKPRDFVLDGSSADGVAHRYRRDDVMIDVLACEGLGPRTDLTTTRPGRTVQVPGGTQALERTELVPVRVGERLGAVPRPSLLGAIIVKCAAVDVDDAPNAQRADLALLLSLVRDPFETRELLTGKDRQRLRSCSELIAAGHPAWRGLTNEAGDLGRATLAILTG